MLGGDLRRQTAQRRTQGPQSDGDVIHLSNQRDEARDEVDGGHEVRHAAQHEGPLPPAQPPVADEPPGQLRVGGQPADDG